MKRRITAVLFSIIGVIGLWIIGLFILSIENEQPSETMIILDKPNTVYQDALASISEADDMTLSISRTQETTVGGTSYLRITEQTVSYNGINTADPRIMLDEQISIDTHSIQSSEIYAENNVYFSVNGNLFKTTFDKDEYLKRLTPAIVLDPSLYDDITGIDTGKEYTINFESSVTPETWLNISSAQFYDARGTATINYNGELTASIFTVSYSIGNVLVRETVKVQVDLATTKITLPNDLSSYTSINYLDGPKMLELASGYLIQTKSVSADYKDQIYFEAFGDRRLQTISMHAHKRDQWAAYVDTTVKLVNDSRIDQQTEFTKNELYLDGRYTVSSNGGNKSENPEITVDTMYNYFQDLLVSTVMLPQYLASSDVTEEENIRRITFTGNSDFAKLLQQNACNLLYQNSELLNEMTVSTDTLIGYLEIDVRTGLPLSSGINFVGSYKTEGLPYQIQYQAEQHYTLPSTTAENEINKAAGA